MTQKVSMKVKTATSKLNRFDMSSNLITTSNYGFMKPIKMISCVPGDKIKLNVSEFTRLMPMPAPTFGSIKSKTRAFFVPFRTVLANFNDFISNNITVDKSGSMIRETTVPNISVVQILRAMAASRELTEEITTSSSTPDFTVDTKNYILTPKGKRVIDWFSSVGCNLFSNQLVDTISALPLLCFVKFYVDWVIPSRFVYNYQPFLRVLKASSFNDLTALFNTSPTVFLKSLLELPFYAFYDDDYFTSAWQNPYGSEVEQNSGTVLSVYPDDGYDEDGNIKSPYYGGKVTSFESNPPVTQGTNSTGNAYANNGALIEQTAMSAEDTPPINYFSLRTLGALQDLINRGKLAGTKVQEYLRTTYGFQPSNDSLQLSTYLGCRENEIMIGDVMSTSGTDFNSLGQFAGRGIGSGSSSFEYECKEHGMFFVTNELIVQPSYTDGIDMAFDQLDRHDFFSPDFDALGCDAIPLRRLSTNQVAYDGSGEVPFTPDSIFGFTPRYSDYKFAFDRLSGDFRLPSRNAGLDSWYLSRTFNPNNFDLWKYINKDFCLATSDVSLNNLDRIFADTSNRNDHFYSIFRIGCTMMRPMIPFSESLESWSHNNQGKEITTSINGGLSR